MGELMARTPLIAGNWKMNLDHLQAVAFVQKLHWTLKDAAHDENSVEVALFPPFTNLRTVQILIDADKVPFVLGAQDLSTHDSGAYTGEETLEQREESGPTAVSVAQLQVALEGVPADADVVVAYEPVWAIGTGQVASPEQAQEVCAALRAVVAEKLGDDAAARTRILYGGSVKSGNVASFLREPDVDGALVGGASIVVDEFAAIIRYQKHVGV